MLAIERKKKEQEQIFEAEATLCESEEIGLINLHIPAKSHNHIKISIYNNTGNIVEIPKGTTLGYLTMEIKDQAPSSIPDFLQLYQALEAVLSQKELDGREHPVTYASRGLTPAKKNYGTPELKYLAIYWAVIK
ncbi:hypothetical protein G9A89_019654 [Geosiphon pyriformis]|nr:hypothetical protein G9A89_019654 [Geosiphon pyriformis]